MTSRSECDDFAAGILEEMQRAKEEMQKWAEDSQRELENLQNSYREEMGSAEAAAGDLRAREREIEAVRKDLEMQAAVHNEQLQKAEEQLRRLQEQAARELPAEIQALEQAHSEAEATLRAKREEAQALQMNRHQELQSLTRGVLFYKHIGLAFERVEEEGDEAQLKMIFTQIDSASPLREFSFTVCVDEGDQYHVQDVDPSLEEDSVNTLVNEVNSANDFAAFVRSMRAAFVRRYAS